MIAASELKWQPLELLDQRFRSNLAALATRDPQLAQRLGNLVLSTPFFVAACGDDIYLGRPGPAGMEIVPNALPAAAARNLASGLFPSGNVTFPVVVGGLAYGWLWDRIAKLPCKVETAPGHRPPIYFLTANLERLWAVLHVLDWREMLADERCVFIVGPDAVANLRDLLIQDPTLPRPKVAVRIEQDLWKEDFDSLTRTVAGHTERAVADLATQLRVIYPPSAPQDLAARFRSGRLRVLGITSRYTTFLQYSMRDWLAGFERLGHETRLLIEPADHIVFGQYGFTKAVLDYRPDLIVLIDHYRSELGTIPDTIPCVMWVQDWLPNMFNPGAGAGQGRRDFSIGFGKPELTGKHGYPAERFMSCPIGINEERFKPAELSAEDWARYGCDVSYVSHASTPSDVLLKNALANDPDPANAKLLWDFHDRLVGYLARGDLAHSDWRLQEALKESIAQTGIEPQADRVREILWLFKQQIYNAIFRHKSLEWVAECGVNLKLYGKDWDRHPTLGRFACGPADTTRDVPKIVAASKINLQIIPFGAVHQRLLEGLAAGGFYLIRWTPGDQLGIPLRSLREWCLTHGIDSESALRSVHNPQVRSWIAECDDLREDHSEPTEARLYQRLMEGAEIDRSGRAGAVWPEEYPQVSFKNAAELRARLEQFLADERERRQIAAAMRASIVGNYSYTNLTRRLLEFMGDGLEAARIPVAAAA